MKAGRRISHEIEMKVIAFILSSSLNKVSQIYIQLEKRKSSYKDSRSIKEVVTKEVVAVEND